MKCVFIISQLIRVPFPAHSSISSPWGHAFRTFHYISAQPCLTSWFFNFQLAVALGLGWLSTQSQFSRGVVIECLHALLWKSTNTNTWHAFKGVTTSPWPALPFPSQLFIVNYCMSLLPMGELWLYNLYYIPAILSCVYLTHDDMTIGCTLSQRLGTYTVI